MKALLLAVLCSAFILQGVRSVQTPVNYHIDILNYAGIQARDVGVGADGTIWYISNNKVVNDYEIYRISLGASAGVKVDGAYASKISVDNNGNAWIIRADNTVSYYDGTTWQPAVPSSTRAYYISCAPDGNVFHVGGSDKNTLYRLNKDSTGKPTGWTSLNNAIGTIVAGGVSQSVWHVNSASDVYRSRSVPITSANSKGWEQILGEKATDIDIGADGRVWISTSATKPNQLAFFDEKKQDWVEVPLSTYLAQSGPATSFTDANIVKVAAAPNGDVIGVKSDNTMFRLSFTWFN